MKKILLAATAATALVGVASPAAAQTDVRHYANPVLGATGSFDAPYNVPELIGIGLNELGLLAGIGTRYTAEADAPNDSTPATPTVNVVFTLSGSVNKDCSFYSGNDASARDIDFGVIGVRTGNNENVNDAFEMVGPAEAEIETLTAGCNFNNEVRIVKSNALGMINTAAGSYDNTEFQANIPYQVDASWTGVAFGAGSTAGSPQSLNVSTTALNGIKQQGAWRSNMEIDITAPVAPLGLVAGNYTGTMTLTLQAL